MIDNPALLLLCNCPDSESARHIARQLVEQRFAACVNCLPNIQSVYRWNNAVEEANEVMLIIKTTAARYNEVQQAIVALHPYDVPEVIAVNIDNGLPEYLEWLGAAV